MLRLLYTWAIYYEEKKIEHVQKYLGKLSGIAEQLCGMMLMMGPRI